MLLYLDKVVTPPEVNPGCHYNRDTLAATLRNSQLRSVNFHFCQFPFWIDDKGLLSRYFKSSTTETFYGSAVVISV